MASQDTDTTEGAGVALVEVDTRDRIVSWSREAEELTGFRSGAVRGHGFCELLEARDLWGNRTCTCGLRDEARRSEPLRSFLVDLRTATGETVRVVVHPVPASGRRRGAAFLVYRLRRDLRRRQDRRRPSHPAETSPSPSVARAPSPLTPRELDVLRLLATGTSTVAIAQRLAIRPATVRNHVQRLLDRLGAHSRLEAVARARDRGWLD